MHRHLLYIGMSVVAILSSANLCSAAAQDFTFTYDYPGAAHDLFGVQRLVQIDAAMLLREPALAGCEVLGISVDIPVKEGCSCAPKASAWLTTRLQVEGEYNLPDIQLTEGLIRNIGTEEEPRLRLDITFLDPYTLTEDGVYIGYSLNVTSCNVPGSGWTAKYPIVTVEGVDRPECFMVHCTQGSSTLPQKYPEWTNLGASLRQALAMQVLMRGEPKGTAATLEPLQVLYAEPGSEGKVYARLINQGISPISSIEYSYDSPEGKTPGERISHLLTLDSPLAGKIGASKTVDLTVEAPESEGSYDVNLRVEKINGLPNDYAGQTPLSIRVLPFIPVNNPLVEDYTGFWCGYCPAVYVAINQMRERYGDDFIPISYHVEDKIQGVATSNQPSSSYGIPLVYMGNREIPVDYENLENLWLLRRRELAPASIDVNLAWTDENHTSLTATSSVKFINDDPEAEYMVTYALIEDNMSDPTWLQKNFYGDKDYTGQYWDLFCGKEFYVSGLIYNDVVVSFPSTTGIAGSLPSSIKGGEVYSHSSTLSLGDAICRYKASPNYGENIILDSGRLRVVAMLIDGRDGRVCNAATTGYSADAPLLDPSVVTPISIPSVEIEGIYTFDGLRINSPIPGINIIRYSDGSVRKILR